MNVLHMKYAVAIADAGSINRASEKLLIAPPNLSRALKELEADLGVAIFDRSARGMSLSPEGEQFIRYARKILSEIDELEKMYRGGTGTKQRFSISVPRASYISDAFAHFSRSITGDPAEIFYKETNSSRAVENILRADYKLGIIRYAANYDRYFKEMLEEKGLLYEVVAEFRYVLIMGKDSPLAGQEVIRFKDLRPLIEIAHGDPYVPSLPIDIVKKEELPEQIERRIYLFERGSQFDLLAFNPETFMWVSPLPDILLERYGLVQRECADNRRIYRDVLIRRKDYRLSKLDKQFITALTASRRKYLAPTP